jgi:hypothetical protein
VRGTQNLTATILCLTSKNRWICKPSDTGSAEFHLPLPWPNFQKDNVRQWSLLGLSAAIVERRPTRQRDVHEDGGENSDANHEAKTEQIHDRGGCEYPFLTQRRLTSTVTGTNTAAAVSTGLSTNFFASHVENNILQSITIFPWRSLSQWRGTPLVIERRRSRFRASSGPDASWSRGTNLRTEPLP